MDIIERSPRGRMSQGLRDDRQRYIVFIGERGPSVARNIRRERKVELYLFAQRMKGAIVLAQETVVLHARQDGEYILIVGLSPSVDNRLHARFKLHNHFSMRFLPLIMNEAMLDLSPLQMRHVYRWHSHGIARKEEEITRKSLKRLVFQMEFTQLLQLDRFLSHLHHLVVTCLNLFKRLYVFHQAPFHRFII